MITMTPTEWLARLQRLQPDVARVVARRGIIVGGELRLPPRLLVAVPTNTTAAQPQTQEDKNRK